MKRFLALAPLILLALIVIAGGFILLRGGAPHGVSAGDLGRPAPPFVLSALDGQGTVTSERFAGQAHVVNFYASWCTPCRAEHPVLMALQREGVAILGVAYKDRPAASQRFLDQLGNPFSAVALDPEGRFALEMGVAGAVPETFVVDAQGRIRFVHRGPLTEEIVEQDLLPALGG